MFTIGIISLAGLLLLFLGVFLPHLLSKDRTKRERFIEASHKLHDAFAEELSILKKPGAISVDVVTLLENAFDKHHMAIITFSRSLNCFTKFCFIKAWERYYTVQDKENKNDVWIVKYSDALNSEFGNTGRQRAIKNIEHILSFAKNK